MHLISLLACAVAALSVDPLAHSAFTPQHLRQLQTRARALFQHGWTSYMAHAFPADEVRPISCVPYGPQHTLPDDLHIDVLGNVSLTVLDNLDTLILMQEWDQLEVVLDYLRLNQATFFEQDHVVQVFEASIRWLGGLLSAHLALSEVLWNPADGKISAILAKYTGFLLEMAFDLGLRLVPVYKTSTCLPLPRTNLARGVDAVPSERNRNACTAGATTPFLELTVLLRLTGDNRFEALTRQTVDKLWSARLPLGLLPMSLDPIGNKWLDMVTGIGALIDSFYEYTLKGAILFNDEQLWDMFSKSYQSLVALLAVKSGPLGCTYFANINTNTAHRYTPWIDLLAAFWPGVQVLAGRLSDAVSSHLVYLKVWDHFDAIPERWVAMSNATDISVADDDDLRLLNAVSLEWYPLRPEFIESTYYLYRATRDPMYLQIGLRVLHLFETRYRSKCGFSGYQDIRSGERQDRMETFVLGELLKYLYLLFDEGNESYVHGPALKNTNWIFSTEAHPLWLTKDAVRRNQKASERFLSHEETETIVLKGKGVLGSMWRGFTKVLNNDLDLQDNGGDIEETTPRGPRFKSGVRPTFDHLLVCETRPIQFTKSARFLGSGYYQWDQLFSPDSLMGQTLVRPDYMKACNETSVIELLHSFIALYGLSPDKKCALQATTKEVEYRIGKLRRPEQYEMYEVVGEVPGFPFAVKDLVMPELTGRFCLELLGENATDRYGERITKNFLDTIRRGLDDSVFGAEREILRVKFLNGLDVAPDVTLWVHQSYLGSNPDVCTITEKGDVYLQEKYVTNLKVY